MSYNHCAALIVGMCNGLSYGAAVSIAAGIIEGLFMLEL
jgi:hypothetical protein